MSHKRQIHLGPEGPSLLCENFNKKGEEEENEEKEQSL